MGELAAELARVQEQLRNVPHPESMLAGMFAFAPFGVQVYGVSGHSVFVNRAFRGTPDPDNWIEYPQAQIDVVLELVKDIVARHKIRPDRIVGHSDIAPQRKIDPGPKFPWKRLADAGLIPWPDASKVAERRLGFEAGLPDIEWFQLQLAKHGFKITINNTLDEETVRVLMVFQMKYRPAKFDGMPDAETAAILDVLVDP